MENSERNSLISTKTWSEKLENFYSNHIVVKYCPWCGSKDYIKYGRYKYTYRYKCKRCMRTFLPSTGTSIHYIHKKDTFIEYAEFIKFRGMQTLKYMCDNFKISPLTSFDWRQKILMSIPIITKSFKGSLLFNDLSILYSLKGRKGSSLETIGISRKQKILDEKYQSRLIIVNENEVGEIKLATVGLINRNHFDRIFKKRLNNVEKLICSEQSVFSNKEEFNFKSLDIVSGKKKQKEISQKLINQETMMYMFKTWINNTMRGVATKYLALYANYFMNYVGKIFNPVDRQSFIQKYIWPFYTLLECFYESFITDHTSMVYSIPTKRKWKTSGNYYFDLNFKRY
jgi:transposase-like protein